MLCTLDRPHAPGGGWGMQPPTANMHVRCRPAGLHGGNSSIRHCQPDQRAHNRQSLAASPGPWAHKAALDADDAPMMAYNLSSRPKRPRRPRTQRAPPVTQPLLCLSLTPIMPSVLVKVIMRVRLHQHGAYDNCMGDQHNATQCMQPCRYRAKHAPASSPQDNVEHAPTATVQ